jgi:hypothetical protein
VPVKCFAFSLSGTKNLRLQPGRYVKYGLRCLEYNEKIKLKKTIDKKWKIM